MAKTDTQHRVDRVLAHSLADTLRYPRLRG
jgi:hypothetical protein